MEQLEYLFSGLIVFHNKNKAGKIQVACKPNFLATEELYTHLDIPFSLLIRITFSMLKFNYKMQGISKKFFVLF